MSVGAVSGSLPAAVAGTSPASDAQRAATQFERMLLEQLTKELAASAAPADGEASAATSAYRDLLPGTMADALSAAGGVGIAAQLAATSSNASAASTAAPSPSADAAVESTSATSPSPTTPSSVLPLPTGTSS